ncbi:hypothetical protein [Roseivivax lentus]|nr:hypothetical protein [Roseivivax lentus]
MSKFNTTERVLRELLALRKAGDFVSLEEGEERTRRMIERKKPEIDQAKLERVKRAELSPGTLNEAEEALWLDWFTERMSEPGPEEEAFFEELRRSHPSPKA